MINKLKESSLSILPVVLIVLICSFTPLYNLDIYDRAVFAIASLVLIFSMSLFNLGVDYSLSLMGEYSSSALLRLGKLSILLVSVFLMGFFVTIAEPDLMVLAEQVSSILNKNHLVLFVGVGVGLFMVLGIVKIVFHKPLSQLLTIAYLLLFSVATIMYELNKKNLLSLSFDSGGVTTGPITVPFIMAFGLGIALTVGGRNRNENSFGLVALSSVGPVIVVMIMAIFSRGDVGFSIRSYSLRDLCISGEIFNSYLHAVLTNAHDIIKSILLIFVFFLILHLTILKLPYKVVIQIVIGLLFTYVGLVLFLASAEIGFLPVGLKIGLQLSRINKLFVYSFCYLLGMTVILAEPAIHVLNKQVENVTSGAINNRSLLIALSVGVGVAIALSMYRIVHNFTLLYYIVPGYVIIFILSYIVPSLYTAIAFDSGGVASGPLSSTFILPLAIGFCSALNGDELVLECAFGTIALIAMTPLITIQLLGFKSVVYKYISYASSKKKILKSDDKHIVYFEYNFR